MRDSEQPAALSHTVRSPAQRLPILPHTQFQFPLGLRSRGFKEVRRSPSPKMASGTQPQCLCSLPHSASQCHQLSSYWKAMCYLWTTVVPQIMTVIPTTRPASGEGVAGFSELTTGFTGLPTVKGCGSSSSPLAWDLGCHSLKPGDKASVEGNAANRQWVVKIRNKKWKLTDGRFCSQERILQFDMVGIQILNRTW